MSAMSFKNATRQEKIDLLGEAFAGIEVIDVDFSDGLTVVRIILDGQVFSLVGDPEKALETYLGGRSGSDELPN